MTCPKCNSEMILESGGFRDAFDPIAGMHYTVDLPRYWLCIACGHDEDHEQQLDLK